MDKVSIIIPVYNTDRKYLDCCLESLINQTYKNIEIIIVDDGSKQEIAEKCDSYLKKDDRIMVFHKENSGISTTRNLGFSKATGKWIFYMDSDDWLEGDSIEKLIKKSENMEVVIGRFFMDDDKYERGCNEEVQITDENKIDLINSIFYDNHNKYCCVESACAKIYLKDFLIKNNIKFNDKISTIGEDAVFNFEVYNKAKHIKYVPDFIYHYRTNETSVMRAFDSKLIQKYDRLLENIKMKMEELGCSNLDVQYNFFTIRQLHKICGKNIFCRENKLTNKEKENIIKTISEKEPYKTAIRDVKIKLLSPKRILLVICLRLNLYGFIKNIYS